MTAPKVFESKYFHRVHIVQDALTKHSKLSEKAATELAVHVLHALDTIPEQVR